MAVSVNKAWRERPKAGKQGPARGAGDTGREKKRAAQAATVREGRGRNEVGEGGPDADGKMVRLRWAAGVGGAGSIKLKGDMGARVARHIKSIQGTKGRSRRAKLPIKGGTWDKFRWQLQSGAGDGWLG